MLSMKNPASMKALHANTIRTCSASYGYGALPRSVVGQVPWREPAWIEPDGLKHRLDAGQALLVADVRGPEEFARSAISAAAAQ
jgi:hypothetical protein